jgi:tetrahydromethanopterin S-methyltransferase subunit D
MKRLNAVIFSLISMFALAGCGTIPVESQNATYGAMIGGAAASMLTHGRGINTAATVLGAGVGGFIGAQADMRAADARAARIMQQAAMGSTTCNWSTSGTTSPTGQDSSDGGIWDCRGAATMPGRHQVPPR